jgi:hypothetical protein
MQERLATKEDLQSVKTELEVLTYKLTIRMGGMFATSIVILGALIRFGH